MRIETSDSLSTLLLQNNINKTPNGNNNLNLNIQNHDTSDCI